MHMSFWGVEMMSKQTIAVDFDGVIHAYSKGFHDGTIYDPPSVGTQAALAELAAKYHVVVLTARARTPELVAEIGAYLKAYDLDQYVSNITNVKPAAVAYIDDRAILFDSTRDNSWSTVLFVLENMGEF